MLALADGGAEWVGAGDVAGMVVRSGGASRDLNRGSPAAGELPDHVYESTVIDLGAKDKLISMSDNPPSLVQLVTSVVTGGYTSSSRDALSKLFGRFAQLQSPGVASAATDLSGVVITCEKAVL
jgi:hypothetical protein